MIKQLSLCAGLLAASSTTLAEGEHAIAAKAGALGLVIEYTYRATDRLAFRAGLNRGGVRLRRRGVGHRL